jgi:hypothetical protein
MIRLALLASMFLASTARADGESMDPFNRHEPGHEPNSYIAAGLGRVQGGGLVATGPVLEAGTRITGLWFARTMGQAGAITSANERTRGDFVEARVGAEARKCTSGAMVCSSVGVDLGVQRTNVTHVIVVGGERTELRDGVRSLVASPRVTFDGGGRLRVRAVLELPAHTRSAEPTESSAVARAAGMAPAHQGERKFEVGVAVSFAFGVAF